MNGVIEINVRQDDKITITVSDNGKGICTENQPHIFDKYFSTTAGKGGSGLGLFITKKMAQSHLYGDINYDTTQAQGACFVLTLPNSGENNIDPIN
jgi:signal transduction histidine kinase